MLAGSLKANLFILKAVCFSAVLLTSSIVTEKATGQIVGRTSAPISGGTSGAARPPSVAPSMRGTYADIHKTPDGKPCISVSPLAEPQKINPKIVDQIVLVNNICGQSIRVQVCYARSSDCIVVPLTGHQKLRRILGISGSTDFGYEYRELY